MKERIRFLLPIGILVVGLVSSVASADWDPDDATFDPEVKSVVAHGSSRLGDPSPFQLEGVEPVGFTYVDARKDAGMGDLVGLSLLVPLLSGESAPRGGAIFLPPKQAQGISAALRKGSEMAEAGTASEVLFTTKGMMEGETWELTAKGGLVLLINRKKEGEDVYQFRPNPARKLAGALDHSFSLLAKSAAE
jgi:hypothetical protein